MKQKGFTLLEMLLVLFAISVLSMVTYYNVHSLYEKQKIEQFLRQFSNDILYMQQLAINRQKHYTLRWHKDRHMYYIGESSTNLSIIKREYDSDIQIDLNTFPNPMTYNPSGNINRGGTILLSYRSYKYDIVFQLGRGRFTYREMSKRVSDG
ncbi:MULTISPECIES: comG operon protein ComGD [Bacillus]|uniref:Prepilin-type N-terminal cleavage/methylation domain-containing protein n=3 Tax=Bacillus cereus group TaxID=86661 RepID=A0A2B0XM66_BACAN|nr:MULTISPECIES: comG operon protein ComGD [Bacillus]MCU0095432.1 comG operon protein ComGD [Bacillus sp. OR9]ALQ69815.1 competence protein ComG [Bacillus thuringiensis]KZD34530.1 Late competence protein ComGD access of DNA to ComEA [Bacillus cereus]MBJ8057305.1 comG operon protein ComGD [Bacillus cereus]MCU4755073.1 comG operon protein ComGD [Bacillus cereus]